MKSEKIFDISAAYFFTIYYPDYDVGKAQKLVGIFLNEAIGTQPLWQGCLPHGELL
ncbi:MAG: hypothetical protein R6U40_05260 [Desulfobacterales bacterium]